MAAWLQAQGQQVTVLFAFDGEPPSQAIRLRGLAGVEQCILPPPAGAHPHLPPCANLELSVRVADYLSTREFDFLHFQDWKATGFVALQRRRTIGLPGDPLITTTLHGGTEREMECRRLFPAGTVAHLVGSHGERWSIQHANAVILPAGKMDMKAWRQERSWEFPKTLTTLPLFGPDQEMDAAWTPWLRNLLQMKSGDAADHAEAGASPALTVCMAHHNHGAYLAEALASLAGQTFTNFTVIVVDDGSTDADSLATFGDLETQYQHRGWQFVRSINRGASGARNHATRLATTPHIVFMDSDNIARPEMLEVLSRAMHRSGADVLTCHFLLFEGDAPSPGAPCLAEYHAVGPCPEAGFLTNVYGDTNFIIRAEVFHQLGGFRELPGFSLEDWDLLSRLVHSGYDLDVVPQSLFYYRHLPDSFSRRGAFHTNHLRVIRPIMESSPLWVKRALLAWFGSEGPGRVGLHQEIVRLHNQVDSLSAKVKQLQQEREEDKTRLQAAKEKYGRLRDKLETEKTRTSKFSHKLRRLFFGGQ